jgi:hypothetical protein
VKFIAIAIAITAILGLAIAAATALESREGCKYTEPCKFECTGKRRALDECLTCIPYCNQGSYLLHEKQNAYVSWEFESDIEMALKTDITQEQCYNH